MNKKTCPVCKEEFLCSATEGDCWCFDYEALKEVNNSSNSCFCPGCLQDLLEKQNKK